jgi:hypothetical protein
MVMTDTLHVFYTPQGPEVNNVEREMVHLFMTRLCNLVLCMSTLVLFVHAKQGLVYMISSDP